MTQAVAPTDPRLDWAGALGLEVTPQWLRPWRLPLADLGLAAPPLLARAVQPSGVRLTFRTDSPLIAGTLDPDAEATGLDLLLDGEFVGSVSLPGRGSFVFGDLPTRSRRAELYLPHFGEFRLKALHLAAGAELEAAPPAGPRWVTYGSSLTQCRSALSPARTWPALVARAAGWHLTNLGFGGQCHLDPPVSAAMRDAPADLLSACLGINIYDSATFTARSLRPAVIGFVRTVREGHPQTPFLIVTPIHAPGREDTPNAAGMTLADVRDEVAAATAQLQAHGDAHLYSLDGRDLLGEAEAHLLPDRLHPEQAGYDLMARRFLARARPLLEAP